MTFLVVLILTIASHVNCSKIISMENVECSTYEDYIYTDPRYYRYYPYVVKLHRCIGSYGLISPAMRKCVPLDFKTENISVFNRVDFTQSSMLVLNHTGCHSECVKNASMCTEHEMWNEVQCKCLCNYDKKKPSLCCFPHVWNSLECGCVCPTQMRECGGRKTWSHEECDCICKPEFFYLCSKRNLTINLNTCSCGHNVQLEELSACSRMMSRKIILVAMLAEALAIIFCFLVYTSFCKRKKLDITHEKSVLLSEETKL